MKKTILALLLIGGSTAVMAQDTTAKPPSDTTVKPKPDTSGQMVTEEPIRTTTTGTYQAYRSATAVPQSVQNTFMTEFPGATDAKWEQSNEWYRVHYKQNGQNMRMHYNERGQSFAMALPVRNGLIPEEVVNKVAEVYGYDLYDVTLMRGDTGESVYQVRVIENGQIRAEKINADGSAYVPPQPMNADSMNMMHQNMDTTMHRDDNMNKADSMNMADTTNRIDTTMNGTSINGDANGTLNATGSTGNQPDNAPDSSNTSSDMNTPNNPSTTPNQQGNKNKKDE